MTGAILTRPAECRELVADPRRHLVVETKPGAMRSLHWGGECGFVMRLLDRLEPVIYGLPAIGGMFEDGGQEFGVILERPPAVNRIRFAVRSWGLRLFPQPDGSYAAYHTTKAGNFHHPRAPGLDRHYRAGKAFHVLQPWAEDATGRRVWCDLRLPTNGVATLTIPRRFLDDAVYPVMVDPTIGYTSIGGTSSNDTNANAPFCSLVSPYTATTGDTITKIHVYRQDTGGGGASVTVAMYSVVAGFPSSKLAADVAISGITTTGWYDTGTISQALSNGIAYDVANGGFPAGGTSHFYDLGAGTQRSIHNAVVALPASWTDNGAGSSRMVSMYADYTVSLSVLPRPLISPAAAVQRAANW